MDKTPEYKNHHIRCKELFKDACTSKTKVWVHLDEINVDNEEVYLSFSIITEEIIKYDGERAGSVGYRPYFMSYIACKNDESVRFAKKYIEYVNLGNNTNANGWFPAVIYDPQNNSTVASNVEKIYEFAGQTEFSASPVEYKKKSLVITSGTIPQTLLNQINSTYKVSTKTDLEIKKMLKPLFKDVTMRKARIYKVGHGNLIKLMGENKKKNSFKMLYDVGYHRGSHPGSKRTNYCTVGNVMQKSEINLVILSHWDTDHIMGVVNAPDCLFDVPWVAPNVDGCSMNARRLACFLEHKDSLYLAKKDAVPRSLFTSGYFEMIMGKNCSVDGVSPTNCSGIVLANRNLNCNSIFCGDVPYKALMPLTPSIWSCTYQNIVVPHHAREMDASPLRYATLGGTAIYCNNKAMNNTHTTTLKLMNFSVIKTEDLSKRHEFKLI